MSPSEQPFRRWALHVLQLDNAELYVGDISRSAFGRARAILLFAFEKYFVYHGGTNVRSDAQARWGIPGEFD